MKLYNAGTTTIDGKEYTIKDNSGIFPISRLVGENTMFFGGRVTKFSRAKDNEKYILLLEVRDDKMVVIDIAVEDVADFPRAILKEMARRKKKKFANNILDADLIKLVS